MTGTGVEMGARAARARALAVLRVRSRALAVALLPAAFAVILLAGPSTGRMTGPGWHAVRWAVVPFAVLVLLAAAVVALVVARSRPAVTPTVPIGEEQAPDLYRLVRDLADRLGVPAPSAIALTPDCDSWLEDRTHPAHGPPPPAEDHEDDGLNGLRGGGHRGAARRTPAAPVLVIGSPFLWWMRVGELRAVLAPVVAGTGPSAHPDIAQARRFVRGLDAAVAVGSTRGRCPGSRLVCAGIGQVARLLLRACREHAAEMERGVAAAAAERAQAVDYGLRIVAQEQVGLAYAGWDRLLTRVALPAWRMGRWPSRLDAGVVAALTELSRRDRLAAEGFASRLGERPACDLLEEPGVIDEATSLLAARLFHGGPAEPGPDWSPVDWLEYPEEVVDRTWRTDAARLHRVLDRLGVRRGTQDARPETDGPTLSRVLDHLATAPVATAPVAPAPVAPAPVAPAPAPAAHEAADRLSPVTREAPGQPLPTTSEATTSEATTSEVTAVPARHASPEPITGPAPEPAPDDPRVEPPAHRAHAADPAPRGTPEPTDAAQDPTDAAQGPADAAPEPLDAQAPSANPPAPAEEPEPAENPEPAGDPEPAENPEPDLDPGEDPETERSSALAAGLTAELAREEAAKPAEQPVPAQGAASLLDTGALPLFPLQPPRTSREVLTDHVTAMVCCAAMDTAGASPGLDWLDGPTLLINGERAADLAPRVLSLIEEGDPAPLRAWLLESGIRPEKPVRLV
ncbi:integral membrane protein [Streptomyces zinciresistens K42]|uniref:Integral membrane protein n=1 Tax=Streptomyces zinciresistens K42 TaxID=700597 RepID=G2G8K1_9ACTN|nr:hypothetical protein [Streptomyces zinciresistens]EGX60222.1 integral membrane protein [Streptomyces zinciresistens K42]